MHARKTAIISRWLLLAMGLAAWMLLWISGCSAGQAQPPPLRIVGALDVLPLAEGVVQPFYDHSGLQFEVAPSSEALAELGQGQAAAALLGREPTAEELQGLESIPVAYDAVCLLLNARSYEGGIQVNQSGLLKEYQARTEGLRELSWEELQGHLGNVYRTADGETWQWQGDYGEFRGVRFGNGQPIEDPDNPGYGAGIWMEKPVYIFGEGLQAGKFDTQGRMLQVMGWPESVLENEGIGFIPSIFESEEEVISFRFYIAPLDPDPENGSVFNFYLLPASRQVTVRALQQRFSLRPIRIAGEECIGSPQAIYSGDYPLSRRVYLLAPSPLQPEVRQLADFLLSSEGQQIVKELSFLPLPSEELAQERQP